MVSSSYLSCDTRKLWLCVTRRLKLALTSAQSDQSIRCPHEKRFGPYLPTEGSVKSLIRLRTLIL